MPKNMIDFGDARIPDHTKISIENYLLYGLPPGGFLTSVLTNNLYGAVASADYQNKDRIVDIVKWLTFAAPGGSYGNYEILNDWVNDTHGNRASYVAAVEKDYTWRSLKRVTA